MWVNKKEKYIGLKGKNNQGYEMEVIDYYDYDHAVIYFLPPYEGTVIAKICHFQDGGIHNPFAPTVSGYGITGSKYLTHEKNGKYMMEYLTWCNMLKRCVDKSTKEKCPSYKNVKCDSSWQFYENFYEWIHNQENFEILKEQNDVNLDKDILIKKNKIYAPDRCVLVPRKINNILLGSDAIRGKYPIGVNYRKKNKKFVAVDGGHKNQNYLGLFDTPEEAFAAYKEHKEKRIQDLANEEFRKGNITKKCYDALMNYQIEITD